MAKQQITAEKIVAEALNLVAERGMDALNARSVAARCGCSTQPIYLRFANLAELKNAVIEEIGKCYDGYVLREISSGKYPEYKASGMGYIRFAKERPNLFKCLFMCNREGSADLQPSDNTFHREAMRVTQYGFDDTAAEKIHTHMWIYVHGIATMYATGFLDWEWETVGNLLSEEFFAIKEKLFGGKNGN